MKRLGPTVTGDRFMWNVWTYHLESVLFKPIYRDIITCKAEPSRRRHHRKWYCLRAFWNLLCFVILVTAVVLYNSRSDWLMMNTACVSIWMSMRTPTCFSLWERLITILVFFSIVMVSYFLFIFLVKFLTNFYNLRKLNLIQKSNLKNICSSLMRNYGQEAAMSTIWSNNNSVPLKTR